MELTFATDLGGTFTVEIEIDPAMELENVIALLEAEVRSPTDPSVFLPPSLDSPATSFLLTRSCTLPLNSGKPVIEQSLPYGSDEGRDLHDQKARTAQRGVGEG